MLMFFVCFCSEGICLVLIGGFVGFGILVLLKGHLKGCCFFGFGRKDWRDDFVCLFFFCSLFCLLKVRFESVLCFLGAVTIKVTDHIETSKAIRRCAERTKKLITQKQERETKTYETNF